MWKPHCGRPRLRQRVECGSGTAASLDSLHTAAGCFSACSPRRHSGTRKDPSGSNLWPGGSCCIAMMPIHSIVQTQAALKRRGKCGSGTAAGLRARSGVEAALRLAGRVGLYATNISYFARQQVEPAQPASRPKRRGKCGSQHCRRVACAERCGSYTAAGRAGRAVLRCYLHVPTSRLEPPQAARKMWTRHCRRVACAKRSGSRHSRRPT